MAVSNFHTTWNNSDIYIKHTKHNPHTALGGFFLYIQSSHKAFICFYSRDRTFSSLRCSSWSALWNKQQWTQNSESSLFGFQFQIGLYLLHHTWFWRDFSTQLSFLYTASISFVCVEGAGCRIQWRLSVRLFFFILIIWKFKIPQSNSCV